MVLRRAIESTQNASGEYRTSLAAYGMLVSVSRKGNCYDNAVPEFVFPPLEVELLSRSDWPSVRTLRWDTSVQRRTKSSSARQRSF